MTTNLAGWFGFFFLIFIDFHFIGKAEREMSSYWWAPLTEAMLCSPEDEMGEGLPQSV